MFAYSVFKYFIEGDGLLTTLYIENIAVIEKTQVNFKSGLNVMTGETGAGKSIVIDSINAILGKRFYKDIIRAGKDCAFISAEFIDLNYETIKMLCDLGYDVEEDNILIIQREIYLNGKNVCRINGRPASVSILKTIGEGLINVHGQHDNYELFSADLHLSYIDKLGDYKDLLCEYRDLFNQMKKIKSELKSLNFDEAEKTRKLDLLNYQINELESADLKLGEMQELSQKQVLYSNSEKICSDLQQAKDELNGNDDFRGALDLIENALSHLFDAQRFISSVDNLVSRVQGVTYELDDCISEISTLLADIDYDPLELESIEERVNVLYKLSKKYGESEEEMISYLNNAKSELDNIEMSDQKVSELNNLLLSLIDKLKSLARTISSKRKDVSNIFVNNVMNELKFLDMSSIKMEVSNTTCDLNINGCDEIEFFISTNPGEPPKPISKIASGGELSRIMLAIKNVLSNKDDIDSLIFDEIDTGISGSAAKKVGLKLKEVSREKQVICITHLPQIASMADNHFLIEKIIKDNRVFTNVNRLTYNDRKYELARMITGATVTDVALKNAEEMLKYSNDNI